MNHLDATLHQPRVMDASLTSILLPLMLGMAVNFLSLAIGEPHPMAAVGLVAAILATITWSSKPLSWVLFVAVIAANPANNTTPVALNLYCAAVFFLVMRHSGWSPLPQLAKVALGFALLSVFVSIIASFSAPQATPSIHSMDLSQPRSWMITWAGGASMGILVPQVVFATNYLLGPFLFIPLIFSRIRQDCDPELLLKGLILGLIMPTLLLFLLARTFGQPYIDANAFSENMLNVSTFRLGRIDIQMIRTQVGIILAALICASFAITISQTRRGIRFMAGGCLAAALYLLLVTGSVGSTIAGLAGMFLILVMGLRRFSLKRYFILLTVGLGLGLGIWTVLPPGIQNYATSRYELRVGRSASSTADRSWRWKKSLKFLVENPSGVGWSLYVEPLHTYPHNDYLTYAIAFGLVCGLIYFLYPPVFILTFLSFRPSAMDPSRFALALAGAGVAVVVLINSLSDHLTSNRWYFNVVWSLIWYAYFASRTDKNPTTSRTP